ncbi:MAG: hypothetical protein WBZ29_04790 [Methanocella sp.]
MRTKKVGILVLAAAVLAVMTSGSAYAWTWDNVDHSQYWGSYASWDGTCLATTPTIDPDTTDLEWQNTLDDRYSDDPGTYPELFWAKDNGQWGAIDRGTPLYFGYAWSPDGDVDPQTETSYTHRLEVRHYYGDNNGDWDYGVSNTQYYKVV